MGRGAALSGGHERGRTPDPLKSNGRLYKAVMAPDAAPPAPPTPPKLQPVRVPIAEEPVDRRSGDFREINHPYSREDAVLEAKRCIQCRRPWSVEACPITQDCREYIRLVAAEDFDGAARVTLRDDPLASSLCKVCYHYCEDACVVKRKGVPVAIRQLKRASLELGRSDLVYVAARPRSQRVAVVGAGPAGLMVAWELGVRGYSVTVFEQEPGTGGLMRTIPEYRMTGSDEEMDRARFRDLDVTFRTDTRIGRDRPVSRLLERDGYAAVFLGLGTPEPRALGVPGERLEGVVPALTFLKELNAGRPPRVGRDVVVVGGGDVAMDSVRSAVRLASGGRVTLLYRRERADMPADPEEVHGAEAEGVRFLFRKSPVRLLGDRHVSGIEVRTVDLGPPDEGGRRAPIPRVGSEEVFPCDTVIVAVGQQADLGGLDASLGLRIARQGWPEGSGTDHATDVPGVYAAGGRSVVYAMGTASEVAEAMDRYLSAQRGEPPTPRPDPFGGSESFRRPDGYTKPIRI